MQCLKAAEARPSDFAGTSLGSQPLLSPRDFGLNHDLPHSSRVHDKYVFSLSCFYSSYCQISLRYSADAYDHFSSVFSYLNCLISQANILRSFHDYSPSAHLNSAAMNLYLNSSPGMNSRVVQTESASDHHMVVANYHQNHNAYAQNAHAPSSVAMQPVTGGNAEVMHNRGGSTTLYPNHSSPRVTLPEDSPSVQKKRNPGRPRAAKTSTQVHVDSKNQVSKPRQQKNNRRQPSAPTTAEMREEENWIITKLRVKHLWDWPPIVEYMNDWNIKQGKKPSFSDAAVYGRFKRNGSKLWAKNGFGEIDPKSFMQFAHTRDRIIEQRMRETDPHAFPHSRPLPMPSSPESLTNDSMNEHSVATNDELGSIHSPPPDPDETVMIIARAALYIQRSRSVNSTDFWPYIAQEVAAIGGPRLSADNAKQIWISNFSRVAQY